MDDCLADFSSLFCDYVGRRKGEPFLPPEGSYGLEDMAARRYGQKIVDDFYHEEKILKLAPITYGVDLFKQFDALGIEQHILTGRPSEQYEFLAMNTIQWLNYHGLSPHSVTFSRKKKIRTMELARSTEFIYGIEDNPDNANIMSQHCKTVWLRNCHYNVNSKIEPNVRRFSDYRDIYRSVVRDLIESKSRVEIV